MKHILVLLLVAVCAGATSPTEDGQVIRKIFDAALTKGKSYENLRQLCKEVGHRLTGSHGDTLAVLWSKRKMQEIGYSNIRLQPFEANLWIRGTESEAKILSPKGEHKLSALALGSSVSTGTQGISAEVVEVNNWVDLVADHEGLDGKIIFYNRPMNPANINTFQSYGETVDQRSKGAIEAAKKGAAAAVVRSVTLAGDHFPHTGNMNYDDNLPQIPGVAISAADADLLHNMLRQFPGLKLYLRTDCKNAGKVMTNNIIGEITGSEFPDRIIVVGAHLDSWDVGEGAHDDGAGIVQALEVLNIFREIGYRPRHTIRCVLYMNEENGVGGGRQYAREAAAKKENHIAAIESDAGGFSPRGFHVEGKDGKGDFGFKKLSAWRSLFEPYDLHYFKQSYAGTDIGPLKESGTVLFGLMPDSQRYFDFHHSAADVFEVVHRRELELGCASIASLVYLIDRDGLQAE